jgi:MFS transporter, CP family, cyanate transporter
VPLMHAAGWGWRPTLAVWAIPAAATLLVWLRYIDGARAAITPEAPAHPRVRRLYRDQIAWHVTLYYGMQNLVYTGAVAWLPTIFVAHRVSQSRAGLLLAIVNLTGMITTLAVPLLAAKRPSQIHLAVAAATLLALGLAGMLIAPVSAAVLWMIAFGLGQGAAFSLALSLILLRSVDAEHATELSGMTLALGYLFGALGPLCLGAIHDLTGGWTWPLGALLLLLLPLLFYGIGASRDRQILASRALTS